MDANQSVDLRREDLILTMNGTADSCKFRDLLMRGDQDHWLGIRVRRKGKEDVVREKRNSVEPSLLSRSP